MKGRVETNYQVRCRRCGRPENGYAESAQRFIEHRLLKFGWYTDSVYWYCKRCARYIKKGE